MLLWCVAWSAPAVLPTLLHIGDYLWPLRPHYDHVHHQKQIDRSTNIIEASWISHMAVSIASHYILDRNGYPFQWKYYVPFALVFIGSFTALTSNTSMYVARVYDVSNVILVEERRRKREISQAQCVFIWITQILSACLFYPHK